MERGAWSVERSNIHYIKEFNHFLRNIDMESEIRHIERIKKKLAVQVEGQTCIMQDISKVGMQLVTPMLLKKRELAIAFQMEEINLHLKGRVCWIKKELNIYQQPEYHVGVYIPEPPDEYVRLVKSLISKETS